MAIDALRLPSGPRYIGPILDAIGEQAAAADASRSVDPAVIAAIKSNDVMRLSASPDQRRPSAMPIGRALPPTPVPAVAIRAPIASRPSTTSHGNGSGPAGGSLTSAIPALLTVGLVELVTLGAFGFAGETLDVVSSLVAPLLLVVTAASAIHLQAWFRRRLRADSRDGTYSPACTNSS